MTVTGNALTETVLPVENVSRGRARRAWLSVNTLLTKIP